MRGPFHEWLAGLEEISSAGSFPFATSDMAGWALDRAGDVPGDVESAASTVSGVARILRRSDAGLSTS